MIREPNTLIINRFDSQCGECGKSADPYELNHETGHTYQGAIEGCGTLFRFVRSNYTGMKEHVTPMRPDLEWVGF